MFPFSAMYWNQSYDGVFHTNPAPVNGLYPKPNLCLSRGGRTISPVVGKQWTGSKAKGYYKDKIEVPDGLHPPRATTLENKRLRLSRPNLRHFQVRSGTWNASPMGRSWASTCDVYLD